ncbi:MAG: hotdog domain-containing protein, partial [Sphingomonas sp.]
INVTVDFMRGGRDKPTRAQGVVTRLGTRVANVEATAWQDDRGKPIAAARLNYLIARR